MPTTIEVSYRVVTPMFCAGANPNDAELRLPSFKGVLRYWWRALAWARFDGNLSEIRQHEDRLFGSSGTGQSQVVLRLVDPPTPEVLRPQTVLTVPSRGSQTVGQGVRYLGYGVMEAFGSNKKEPKTKDGELTRACLQAPFDFTVEFRCRDRQVVQLLIDALKAVGTLAGVGARSRRGYGSLALRSLHVDGQEQWSSPASPQELGEAIRAFRPTAAPSGMPAYTAFSGDTRHVLLGSSKREPLEVLDLVGREMIRYRSWGHNGKILGGIDSEKQFQDDHDLMTVAGRRTKHPRRVAFGLPHNYGRPKDKQVGPSEHDLDRRASPLFIHLHDCGPTPVAVLSFFPARFLPQGKSELSVGGTQVAQVPEDELYRPVHAFLDRLLDPTQRKEPFTTAMGVGV